MSAYRDTGGFCGEEIVIPVFDEWRAVMESNLKRLKLQERESFRTQVLALAQEYTSDLAKSGKKLINEDLVLPVQQNNSIPVIATGHQPDIYHSGILYKYKLLQSFAKKNKAIGLNVIIDTDSGEAGSIKIPVMSAGSPDKRSVSLKAGELPLIFQHLPEKESLKEKLDEALNCLPGPARGVSIDSINDYLLKYLGLAGQPVSLAHSLMRRILVDSSNCLDVPFSHILRLDHSRAFFKSIVEDFSAFSADYNNSLNAFRQEKKIKNRANPFPNLEVANGFSELPFWILDQQKQSRFPLYVKKNHDKVHLLFDGREVPFEELSPDFIIAPKAALITLFLRLYACDLFIHGTGGARYDEFTDLLMQSYFKVAPPSYVTASQNRYFFCAEIKQYEKEKKESEQRREMRFHIEKFIDNLDWPQTEKSRIQELVAAKAAYIEKIKAGKQQKQSTAEFTQGIKQIEREIAAINEKMLGPQKDFAEPSKSYIDTIYTRDFSGFVFDCS